MKNNDEEILRYRKSNVKTKPFLFTRGTKLSKFVKRPVKLAVRALSDLKHLAIASCFKSR